MKAHLLTAIWLASTFLPITSLAEGLFDQPEGCTYDAQADRWLVSNWADGNIIAIDDQGQQSIFSSYLEAAAGMHIVGNTLYVAAPTEGLVGFDLETAEPLIELPIPGMNILNDLASDTSGFLYITDWQAGRLIKVRLSDYSYSVMVTGLPLPNGIVFDSFNNRMLLCCTGAFATIMEVNLADSTVSLVVNPGTPNCDGLTVDGAGYYYFSCWPTSTVYKYDPMFLTRETISTGHAGPASIFFDSLHDVMGVPNFNGDYVDFITFPDTDADGTMDVYDNCPGIANPDQTDSDYDTFGDACDECTDTDLDGSGDPGFAANTCPTDNCPATFNPDQADFDGDGLGDDCDGCTDSDNDGFGDPGFAINGCAPDNCPETYNPGQEDADGNSIGDACEGCCVDHVGDANSSGDDEPTIGDISSMIDAKFLVGTCNNILDCLSEADVNQSGGFDPVCDDITIGDISLLIDYLFITGPAEFGPLNDCH